MTDHRTTRVIPRLFDQFQGPRTPERANLAKARGTRVRPLGCCERFFHRYALSFPVHFCLVAQIEGAVEAGTLRAALDQVRGRYAALKVCIRDEAESGPAFHAIDQAIELQTYPVGSDAHWPQLVEVELNRPFDPAPGPLMRTTALLAPDSTAIVLTFHHAIADALSSIRVLDALMRALAGERLDALPPLPPVEQMLAGFAASPAAARQHAPEGATPIRTDSAARPPKCAARISILEWSEDETARLIARCKFHGTTVHGAICAAAAQHLPASDDGVVRLHCPMDLRGLTGREIGDCGVFVGAGTVAIPAAHRTRLWSNARDCADRLRGARSRRAVVGMLEWLAAAFPPVVSTDQVDQFFATQPPSSGVISNLGVLPLSTTYGSWTLKAVWGPAMLTNPPGDRQTIGVSTFAGRLRMVHQSHQPISGLLNAVRDSLLRSCVSTGAGSRVSQRDFTHPDR